MIPLLDDLLRQLVSASILRGGVPVLVKDAQLSLPLFNDLLRAKRPN